jgi:hypothetical protein
MSVRRWYAFATLAVALLCARSASAALLINEVDSDTVNSPGTDPLEFVELYDTSGGSVSLDGYVLVFYNGGGSNNVVYRAEDLDGLSTNANGYFVAGAVPGAQRAIPANTIQNGVDAIALYLGDASSFPNGAAVTTANIIDAVVYKTGADTDGVGLATALGITGPVSEVDEFGRDGQSATGAIDSIGRLPNGSGTARNTTAWTFMQPTPNAVNAPIPEPATWFLTAISSLGLLAAGRRR